MQKITSAKTSINKTKVPALFRKVNWVVGSSNLDIGGGKYDTATIYLSENYGVWNHVYDPYNRSKEHNEHALGMDGFDSCTLSNVLNVIKERKEHEKVVRLARKYSPRLFVTIYAGDGTGRGRVTCNGYQHNKKLEAYIPLIRKFYSRVIVRKGVIYGID